jgi:tRNA pseudouridine55 synthase
VSLDGLLLLDKPGGPTSHDIVNRARRAAGQRRVGHAGTLDPMAAGLLPLVLGRATRLVRFLPAAPKCYEGRLLLGRTTTTDDVTGETLGEHDAPLPPEQAVLEAARALLGRQSQVAPAYSAKRVGGRRLYELARRGEAVPETAAAIEVSRFELTPAGGPGLYDFVTEVSSGTYVRGLARDLGARLGCGGILTALTRTAIGPLRLAEAHRLPDELPGPDWVREALIPLESMPLLPPTVRLEDEELARRFSLGAAVRPALEADSGPARVLAPGGRLLGVGEIREGALHPTVVLSSER